MLHVTDWREVQSRLRPFVARRVPSSDVDDVVQDVFLRMQRGLVDLRDDERFGPWVWRVARSAIVDHHRSRARHPLAHEEHDEPAPDPEEPEPDLTPYVASFVAMLPPRYREALTLTELEGMSQKAAAEMLGISLTAMKSRVQRGRAQLREAFDACCRIALDPRGRVIDCEPRVTAPCACDGRRRQGPA